MAKRTNKTDHVLNLLSGNKKETAQNEGELKQAPPVDPKHKYKQEELEAEEARHSSPGHAHVSVVNHSADGESPIAKSVKDSLEEEMDRYTETRREMEEAAAESVKPSEPEPEPESESQAGEPAEEAEIPPMKEREEAEDLEEPDAPPAPEPESEPEPEPEQPKEEPRTPPAEEPKQPEEEPKDEPEEAAEEPDAPPEPEAGEPEKEVEEPEEERSFAVVNVMEHLVRDKAEMYMKQFGNCTCSRCVEDTIALALTNLPAKYVVVNKDTISPLLNFYEKRYAGQITVEITKACIKVKESPRH